MPAGLDGNPDPDTSRLREQVLDAIVERSLGVAGRPLLVGVDGRSGSGKSTFADELARTFTARGEPAVIRSTTDSFHNPREVRYRRGAKSPEGYYFDSFNVAAIRRELLDPVKSGSGRYRSAVFDEPSDMPVEEEPARVHPAAVLVFDGLFLHRPELLGYWDVSVLLVGDDRALRDTVAWAERETRSSGRHLFFWSLWWWSHARRYVEGWSIYESECNPARSATFVVDNNDFVAPYFV